MIGTPLQREGVLSRVFAGGFPEVVSKASESRRTAWFASYTTTVLERDVRDLANIEDLAALPRLLSLLGARSATLLNYSELARTSGLAMTTLKRYFALLEAIYMVQTVPAWASNLSKRLVKSPKLYLSDTGLLAFAMGLAQERLALDPRLAGQLLENFVVMELRKQIGWSRAQPFLFHYRTQTGQEVDVLLEDRGGRIAGIEIKASASVEPRDVRTLRELAEELGPRFVRGVVLYTGETIVPFSDKIFAVPVSALWRTRESPPLPVT